jgi:hypothetical protein
LTGAGVMSVPSGASTTFRPPRLRIEIGPAPGPAVVGEVGPLIDEAQTVMSAAVERLRLCQLRMARRGDRSYNTRCRVSKNATRQRPRMSSAFDHDNAVDNHVSNTQGILPGFIEGCAIRYCLGIKHCNVGDSPGASTPRSVRPTAAAGAPVILWTARGNVSRPRSRV